MSSDGINFAELLALDKKKITRLGFGASPPSPPLDNTLKSLAHSGEIWSQFEIKCSFSKEYVQIRFIVLVVRVDREFGSKLGKRAKK